MPGAHKISLSREPREAVNRALGNLESAHVAFSNIWKSEWNKTIRFFKAVQSAENDIMTCCLMAICHRYMNEIDLMNQAINDATEAMNYYKYTEGLRPELASWKRFSSVLNPASYVDLYNLMRSSEETIYERDFTEFCTKIKNIS